MEIPQQGSGSHGQQAAGPGAPLSPPLSPGSAEVAALANARWNPTKEQVAVLEGLYEHGLRTPNAEQIQQITARLREHGHIEGKNVFYWFQNHKARQRQKQKQDSFAYFTRLLRRPPPLPVLSRPIAPPYPPGRLPPPAAAMAMAPPPASACNNNGGTHGAGTRCKKVMYRPPCFMPAPPAPAANAAYYHPQQSQMAVLYPRMEIVQEKVSQAMAQASATMHHAAAPNKSSTPRHVPQYTPSADGGAARAGPSRETLQLFPLQPTFVLPDKGCGASLTATPSAFASFSGESDSLESPSSNGEAPALPFYDFFGVHSGGR